MNFNEHAGMYETFSRAEVDRRVQEFEQGKNALTEHVLDGGRVLRTVQTIPMKDGLGGDKAYAATFFDNASTGSVVRNKFALRLASTACCGR